MSFLIPFLRPNIIFVVHLWSFLKPNRYGDNFRVGGMQNMG